MALPRLFFVMQLILWRHADAEDGAEDAARRLTAKGLTQATRMAAWLAQRLPDDARILVSPAVRAQQTAAALGRPMKTTQAVNTGVQAVDVLRAAGWPDGAGTVVVVGHQPSLGAATALALTGKALPWSFEKASVWWLSSSHSSAAVVAVMSVDLL
jgi:phosphohistidine phosphatase